MKNAQILESWNNRIKWRIDRKEGEAEGGRRGGEAGGSGRSKLSNRMRVCQGKLACSC